MSIQAVAAVLEADIDEVAAKMLLVCIANAHNRSTGVCSPSISRLMKESSMARSSVKKWLAWLAHEDHRFIEIEERHDESGRQMANAYRLTILGEGPKLGPRGSILGPSEGPKLGPSQNSAPAERSAPRGPNCRPPL